MKWLFSRKPFGHFDSQKESVMRRSNLIFGRMLCLNSVWSGLFIAQVLSLSFCCFACGQQLLRSTSARRPLTDFVPSKNMLQQTNFSGRGTSVHGTCSGIVELAVVNYERNKFERQNQIVRGAGTLSRIEKSMKAARTLRRKPEVEAYVRDIMNLAQNYSASSTFHYFPDSKMPKGTTVAGHLVDELKATGLPQRVVFSERVIPHAVLVFDAVERGGKIKFHIADPNFPSDNNRVLVFDKRSETWQRTYTDPKTGATGLKDTTPALMAKPDLPAKQRRFPSNAQREFYLSLTDYARRGTDIREIQRKLGVAVDEVPVPGSRPGSSNTQQKTPDSPSVIGTWKITSGINAGDTWVFEAGGRLIDPPFNGKWKQTGDSVVVTVSFSPGSATITCTYRFTIKGKRANVVWSSVSTGAKIFPNRGSFDIQKQ